MIADPETTRFVGDGQPLDRMNAWRSMAMLIGHHSARLRHVGAGPEGHPGEFIGRVGLLNPEGWPDVELGWMLVPQHRQQGYATEATTAVVDFAFRSLGMSRSISLIRVDNVRSERVARRPAAARARRSTSRQGDLGLHLPSERQPVLIDARAPA